MVPRISVRIIGAKDAILRAMKTRVIRAGEHGWDGVEIEGYRPGAAVGVQRHTILGGRKDDAQAPGPKMELRYFELAPGAVSRLEKHEHEHYVIVKRGIGYAILGTTMTEIAPNDVIYVGPLQVHQFVNRGEDAFGFYCIVDACRDFSQEPSAEELAALQASPAGAIAKPFVVPPPAKRVSAS